MRFVELPKEQYAGYELKFEYDTSAYYDIAISGDGDGFSVAFALKSIPRQHKTFTASLYAPYLDDPRAFALQTNEGALAAIMEVSKENRNNRLRVSNLLVFDGFRRRGYGTLLLCKAKALARSLSCRALILETQSCNTGAIRFYLSQGLTLMGFNACEYSNEDLEKHEARMEMGLLIPQNKPSGGA